MPYYGYNPYMPYQMPQAPQQPTQTSFVHVQNEEQAKQWTVALGSSVTFIDDNDPYCYTKSMGMSQFDAPVFKRFRLVEEPLQSVQNTSEQPPTNDSIDLSEYVRKADFEPFKQQIEDIQIKLKELTDYEPVE